VSLIVAIKTKDEFVVASDGLSMKLIPGHTKTIGNTPKIFPITGQKIVFGYSGVSIVGERARQYLIYQFSMAGSASHKLCALSSYLAGLNKGFSLTKDAEVISTGGMLPLTGAIITGYYGDEEVFSLILPDGNVLFPEKYAAIGYDSKNASLFLSEEFKGVMNRSQAIGICQKVILRASNCLFSNKEFFCYSVSSHSVQKI